MPQHRKSHTTAAILAAVLLASSVAPRALADNKTVATQLFDDAKKLMDDGKASEACPKLEESMRLDPADGTELRLAYCYELVGRYATAWGLFKGGLEKAKKANNQKRIEFATEHLAIVEPQLSRITLVLDPAAKSTTGLVVKWDGEVVGQASLGTALPFDSGPHTLEVSAPGKATVTTTVNVVKAKQETVSIGPLKDAAVVPATGSDGPGAAPWIIGGAGLAFLGGAIFSRLQVSSAQSDRQSACASQHTISCGDDGVSKIQTWDRLSFVFGGLAIVGIGASVVMFTSSGSKGTPATKVGAGPATIGGAPGFQLQGSF